MPPRLTAQDFDQELLILFDAYVHGNLDRRGFLNQAQKFAKAGITASGLLAALSPDFAAGQQVPKDDPRLNPHIEDIARRLALDGFMAFAPDALTPVGGYPGDEDKARDAFATLDQAKAREEFVAAANWLRARVDSNGKLGAVGFCYGGGIVHVLTTRLPNLNAAVPFYGNTPAPEEAAKVKAPLLVQQAAVDERINAA
jgi:carboxymethylenebutenolidase